MGGERERERERKGEGGKRSNVPIPVHVYCERVICGGASDGRGGDRARERGTPASSESVWP